MRRATAAKDGSVRDMGAPPWYAIVLGLAGLIALIAASWIIIMHAQPG